VQGGGGLLGTRGVLSNGLKRSWFWGVKKSRKTVEAFWGVLWRVV